MTHPLTEQQKHFAREYVVNLLAHGMARGRAATAAAETAGYSGSALTDNARRLTHHKCVKAYIAQLASAQPAEVTAAEAAVIATLQEVKLKLSEIIRANVDLKTLGVAGIIAAARELADLEGWHAAEKHEHLLYGHGDRLDRAFARGQALRSRRADPQRSA
ncbi:MAG TPA: terminase small subunit [Terracidiphilus sp.]